MTEIEEKNIFCFNHRGFSNRSLSLLKLIVFCAGIFAFTACQDNVNDISLDNTDFNNNEKHLYLNNTAAPLPVLAVYSAKEPAKTDNSEAENLFGQGGYESPKGYTFIPEVVSEDAVEVSPVDSDLYYIVYRIKKGDMIGFLAESFGVTQDTIISVNSIKQSRLLQIGQYLKIPNMPGILYTVRKNGESAKSIADYYKVSAEKCAAVNKIGLTDSLKAGTSLFIPDAELDWVTRQEINGDLFIKPLKSRFYFSSLFGWRSSPFTGQRSYHSGIDMAAVTGTPVYAALAGKVSTVCYDDRIYGNYVIVTHHSGYKTLYGHLSKISVKKGQNVTTASILGQVGSTGLSTGPHLHFTVYKNGVAVNPANLWK